MYMTSPDFLVFSWQQVCSFSLSLSLSLSLSNLGIKSQKASAQKSSMLCPKSGYYSHTLFSPAMSEYRSEYLEHLKAEHRLGVAQLICLAWASLQASSYFCQYLLFTRFLLSYFHFFLLFSHKTSSTELLSHFRQDSSLIRPDHL